MSGKARSAFTCRWTSSSATAFFGQIVVETKSLEARERLMPTAGRNSGRSAISSGRTSSIHTLSTSDRPSAARSSIVSAARMFRSVRARALDARRDRGCKNHASRCARPSTGTSRARSCASKSFRTRRASSASPRQDIANILNGIVGGTSDHASARQRSISSNVVGRAQAKERNSINTLQSLQVDGVQRQRRCPCSPSPVSATISNSRSSGAATGCATHHPAVHRSSTPRSPPTVVAELKPPRSTRVRGRPCRTGYYAGDGRSRRGGGQRPRPDRRRSSL